jgi:Pyruvate/2-oxoacid:ferredoxin oxidoreductase delta subunit
MMSLLLLLRGILCAGWDSCERKTTLNPRKLKLIQDDEYLLHSAQIQNEAYKLRRIRKSYRSLKKVPLNYDKLIIESKNSDEYCPEAVIKSYKSHCKKHYLATTSHGCKVQISYEEDRIPEIIP